MKSVTGKRKRTIAPEHVLKALEVLGFGEYIEEVYAAYEQHRHETMLIQWTETNCSKNHKSLLRFLHKTHTESLSLNVLTQDTMRSGKWSNGAEMTEEEALAEQQRMFAEARARMNGGGSAPKQSDAESQPTSNS
ncbi:UNVERIFIED_CONTAM: protein Dr1 [Sesamum angustifolium]|uniref:Protein Dr1 n=1 Tax=Sesamum angustifolium TaxID=2727405 RepID=A0AAW2IMG9_9LAMI